MLPGAEAGIWANVDWIAKAHPEIDLASPPARPPPLHPASG